MSAHSRFLFGCTIAGLLIGGPEASAVAQAAPPAAPAPSAAKCDPAGSYRLRHRSNGAEGWWFRFQVNGSPTGKYSAEVLQKAFMLGIPAGPIQLATDTTACTLVLTAKTEHAGDIRIALTLVPGTNAVAGELTRSKTVSEEDSPAPIAGVRDVGPVQLPACLRPGFFELSADRAAKWKLTEGRPFRGDTCKQYAVAAETVVRIEPLGDVILVDGASEEMWSDTLPRGRYHQDFSRGKVTRISECEISLKLGVQDLWFQATLKLDGDKITGVASKAEFQVFNDGEAGENIWKCGAKNVAITGKRIAD